MKTLTKPMIALGILGAIAMGTAGPSLARDVHARAMATGGGYGAYAQVPTSRNGMPMYRDSARNQGTTKTWDPYGLRWDGAGSD